MKTINISKDFSPETGFRFRRLGKYSGEEFRDEFLIPALKNNRFVVVELDDNASYGSSFLEEAFGGAVRKGLDITSERLEIKSKDDLLVKEVWEYINDAMEQCKR